MKKPAKKPVVKPAAKPAGPGGKAHHPKAGAKTHQQPKPAPKAAAKPAPVSRATRRARRQSALKAAKTRKQHARKRGLTLAGEVACCAAEALAASLRLAGWPVTDADVLALYRLTADGPDEGASIGKTLDAATEYGLAGVWPVSFSPWQMSMVSDLVADQQHAEDHEQYDYQVKQDGAKRIEVVMGTDHFPEPLPHAPNIILGVDLPGPHAVCADGGTWWSWGEPWCPCAFGDAVIEEAWMVAWPEVGT